MKTNKKLAYLYLVSLLNLQQPSSAQASINKDNHDAKAETEAESNFSQSFEKLWQAGAIHLDSATGQVVLSDDLVDRLVQAGVIDGSQFAEKSHDCFEKP